MKAISLSKTVGYYDQGVGGWVSCFVKAILCNWMVCCGIVFSKLSTNVATLDKIVTMWLPIFAFFCLGFEHIVVNYFIIPMGMMFGAEITM